MQNAWRHEACFLWRGKQQCMGGERTQRDPTSRGAHADVSTAYEALINTCAARHVHAAHVAPSTRPGLLDSDEDHTLWSLGMRMMPLRQWVGSLWMHSTTSHDQQQPDKNSLLPAAAPPLNVWRAPALQDERIA
eukprot:363737-Chlamydomonas_euryale.AAC.11